MASKLLRSIRISTPVRNVGRLHRFDPAKSILDFYPSKRDFRRVKTAASRQIATLSFYELNTLVAPDDRQTIYDDFMTIESWIGESAALDLLRAFLIENHLCNELLRIAYDPTKPLPVLWKQLAKQLFNVFEIKKRKAKAALKRLHRRYRFNVIAPAIQLLQHAPNAPNRAPALSLAAA